MALRISCPENQAKLRQSGRLSTADTQSVMLHMKQCSNSECTTLYAKKVAQVQLEKAIDEQNRNTME